MIFFGQSNKTPIINIKQIKALLWKDLIIRLRQPWMTAVQCFWPCFIFLIIYTIRHRFHAEEIPECQFPTRELPNKAEVLPFFQSYICTISNECMPANDYQEISTFENAPITPVINILQVFLNENSMYNAIVELPNSMNFIGTITAVVTSTKFSILQENINTIRNNFPEYEKKVNGSFDVTQVWSDDTTFSKFGNILCGKPFPRSNDIRFVDRIYYHEDYNGPDADELEVMPTKYCKQLYLDVTNTNRGKITWNKLKPIIQGNILYGPQNELTKEIISFANGSFEGMARLKVFVTSVHTIITKLRTDDVFKSKFQNFLNLAKMPFVQSIIKSFSIDSSMIEGIFNTLMNDTTILTISETASNILDCFSVDRFIPIDSEEEMEQLARKKYDKKLFWGGAFFNEHNNISEKEFSYKLRMDIDNTPVTIENRNKFWFPGPDGSFSMNLRYHRGFIELQNAFDQGIIKTVKKASKVGAKIETTTQDMYNEVESEEITSSIPTSTDFENFDLNFTDSDNVTESLNDYEDYLNFDRDEEKEVVKNISKRSPQFGGLLNLFVDSSSSEDSVEQILNIDELQTYTKQFPYPKYTIDDFKKSLYLAQVLQIAFFFALFFQVSTSVRHRIWMKESGNSTLMHVMGLRKSSENIAWITTSIIEISLIFVACCVILYLGGILQTTSIFFTYFILFLFGLSIVAFCYMASTFFTIASLGSVSTVILFLMTFMPYIVIVSLGTTLSFCSKFIANLSVSTAFCYAWCYIMRLELQDKDLSFLNAFDGSIYTNDLKFGVLMIIFDLILYAIVGYLFEHFSHDEDTFYKVPVKDMESKIGATINNVTKTYGAINPAVNNVSIEFKRDFITCLLGRNGSGKSTIIKLLSGQIRPTSGNVYLQQNLDRISGNEFEEKIGICPQNNVLIPNLTAKEHLELYASIKVNDRQFLEVEKVMKCLAFGEYVNYRSEELSGGFKRRLNIAIAFIGSPNLVILDEPCSTVDIKARRKIWELIRELRKDRTVILATHFLDEAEHLSDNVVILNEGQIVSENSADTLKDQFTKSFDLKIQLSDSDKNKTIEELKSILEQFAPNCSITDISDSNFSANISYYDDKTDYINFAPLIKSIENLQTQKRIQHFKVSSDDLEGIFNKLNTKIELENGYSSKNGYDSNQTNDDNSQKTSKNKELTEFGVIKTLFWKRFMHFKRNYRLILCIFILPMIFEMIAMGFMYLRPPGEYDNELTFSTNLYPDSKQFYSLQFANNFDLQIFDFLPCNDCEKFNTSEEVYRWLLNTHDQYIERRYGGQSFNNTKVTVWYNNKGYHSMPVYINELNTALFRSELNDSDYKITTINHPFQLGTKELSTSSVLQKVADAGISIILLIAFSFIVAGGSVYIVNERINGEKLQQKLCGVSFRTYWGVSFLWDLIIFSVGLLLAVIVFKMFNIPTYTAKGNLGGVCLLLFMFGFATIPMVHLCEKLFTDASLANVYILCMNVTIAVTTIAIILVIDILGDSDASDHVRNILNRLFLVFPQHALADGLIELCKNHIVADILERFYINTYKSPILSDLLRPHFISLFILGIIFMVLNFVIEGWYLHRWINRIFHKNNQSDLQNVTTIPNAIKKDDKYDLYLPEYILKVTNLCKTYKSNHIVLKNVSFHLNQGECLGLLGANGAGKSTIFSILSGQFYQTSGHLEFFDKKSISYCAQTSALDNLLTVNEIIYFYGVLRKTPNIEQLTNKTLRSFNLEQYQHILVKNLSGGNRRKLNVAVSCFGDTNIVLMDEPTSDMDPVTRSLVYKAINDLITEKRSVLLTSHTITEIDRICHRIGLIREGEMISIGPPSALKAMYGNSYLVTVFYDQIEALSIERDLKKAIPGLNHFIIHNHSLQFTIAIKVVRFDSHNNEIIQEEGSVTLSDLFNRLHTFASERSILYTISECLLDHAFEKALASSNASNSYTNAAFAHSETST